MRAILPTKPKLSNNKATPLLTSAGELVVIMYYQNQRYENKDRYASAIAIIIIMEITPNTISRIDTTKPAIAKPRPLRLEFSVSFIPLHEKTKPTIPQGIAAMRIPAIAMINPTNAFMESFFCVGLSKPRFTFTGSVSLAT